MFDYERKEYLISYCLQTNGKLNKNKVIQEDAEMYLPFLMERNEVRTNESQ